MAVVARKPAPSGFIGWLTRLADFANPILVKETRQALKSRQFVATFMLLLVASWIVSSFLLLNAGDQLEFRAVGRTFFFGYYMVLALAVLAIVPFNAFRSLQAERELNTYDLLSITAMSPRQTVWGKLLSAVVQCFLYYSAITPFIAFSSLLQGFDLFQVLFLLFITQAQSILGSMIALMLSSFARTRQWTGLLAVLLLGSLFWLTTANIFGLSQFVLRETIPFDNVGVWIAFGVIATAAVSYFFLFLQIATAQLTFESDNRSTGIRVTCTIQLILLWAITFGLWIFRAQLSLPPRAIEFIFEVLPNLALGHVALTGLVFATEGDFLSRRVRRTIPRNFLLKGISVPFWPGGSRGLLYLLLHLAFTLVAMIALTGLRSSPADVTWWKFAGDIAGDEANSWPYNWKTASLVACYCVICIGLIAFLSRTVLSLTALIRPAHMRVVGLLFILASGLFPFILRALDVIPANSFSYFDFTNPILLIEAVLRGRTDFGNALLMLAIGAGFVLLLNARALVVGIIDILSTRQRRQPTGFGSNEATA